MELENNTYVKLVNQYYSKLRNSPLIETTNITDPRELQYVSIDLDGTKVSKQLKLEQLKQILEDNEVNDDNIDVVHWANIMFEPSIEQYDSLSDQNKWKYLGILLYNMDENQQYYDFLLYNFIEQIYQYEPMNTYSDIRNRIEPMPAFTRHIQWQYSEVPTFYHNLYITIEITGCHIPDLSILPKSLPNLTSLSIFDCEVTDISALSTMDLPKLERLILKDNNIQDVTGLEGIENLEVINLKRNRITNVSPLRNLDSLTSLNLSRNNIVNAQFQRLPKLKNLELHRNHINEINIEQCPNLKLLDLSSNRFVTLIHFPIRKIKNLNISHNPQLMNIDFQDATNLQILDLSENSNFRFQSQLDLPNLYALGLQDNPIRTLQNMPIAPKLQELNMDNMSLFDFTGIDELYPDLKMLSLRNNHIQSMQFIPSHPLLEILDLKYNDIQTFQGMNNYPNLEILNVSDNNISSFIGIKGVQQLRKLQELDVQYNQITSFEHLPQYPMLNYLNVFNNQITSIEYLPYFQYMNDINIGNNFISEDEDEFEY